MRTNPGVPDGFGHQGLRANEEINMNISSAIEVKTGPITASQPNVVTSKAEFTTNSTHMPPEIPTTKVSISGQALLKQRIFDGGEPRYRPIAQANMYLRVTDFLTKQDCQLLSEAYEFAQESGADLEFVDNLGFSLAEYRSKDNGRHMHPHGDTLDGEGHLVSFSFLDKDAATIKRILASDELKTTRLDQGFIRFKTDVNYSATSLNCFEFLEQVINKFSAKGADVPPLDARFSRYEYPSKKFNMHLSTEKYENGPNGRVRKGTAGTNANDPNAALDRKKKNLLKTKPAASDPLQDTLRRIMSKVLRANSKTGIPSLADFLMKFTR